MDKLNAISTLVAIVDHGSLTKAGQHLDMSLAAVVRTLAGLEESLGVRLINRTTRRLSLTDEGRDYVERCRRLLADVQDMEAVLTDRQQRPSGRLAITAPVMCGRGQVVPVVSDFLASHPEMRIDRLLLDRVMDLLEEGIDLAIRIGALPDSSLVGISLGSTRRVICASPALLASTGMPMQPADLGGQPVIRFTGLSDGSDWTLTRGNERVKLSLREVFAANQVDAALAACRKGLGFGRFFAYQVREALADGSLVSVLDTWDATPVPVSVVYPHGRLQSPRIRA